MMITSRSMALRLLRKSVVKHTLHWGIVAVCLTGSSLLRADLLSIATAYSPLVGINCLTTQEGPITASATCNQTGANLNYGIDSVAVSTYAFSQYGQLKAFASFSAVVEPHSTASGTVSAEADFYDQITIVGTGSGFISVTGFLHGTGPADAGKLLVGFGNNGEYRCTVQNVDNTGSCTFLFPISFGSRYILREELLVIMQPTVDASASSLGGNGAFAANFLNTAGISTLAVLDANMTPLPGALVVTGSGTVYPQMASTVPEPSSLILLSKAMIAVGWLVRRRIVS